MYQYPHETAQNVALFLCLMIFIIAIACMRSAREEANARHRTRR